MIETRLFYDIHLQVSSKVTYDVVPGTKAAISFNVPDHKSGKVHTYICCCCLLRVLESDHIIKVISVKTKHN